MIVSAMPEMHPGGIGMQYSAVPMSAQPVPGVSYSSMFANIGDPHQIAQAIFRAVSIDVSAAILLRKCCAIVKYMYY